MSDNQEKYKSEMDSWTDQWEKAQKEGIFKDAERPPGAIPQTAQDSYFGIVNTNPSDEVQDADAEYWADIYNKSVGKVEIITEASKKEHMSKEDKVDTVKSITQSPNPIRHHTTGKDQEIADKPLGNTFSPEELEELGDLKKKIHELEDELNRLEGEGKNAKKYEKQIATLKKQLDDFSDSISKPREIDPQGD